MNLLIPGFESPERIELMLSLTKISSENLINALMLHYTVTYLESAPWRAAIRHNVQLSNFVRGQERLEEVAAIVEKIKELDWEKYLAKLAAANARITELEQLVSSAANYLYAIGMNEELEQQLSAAISYSKEKAA